MTLVVDALVALKWVLPEPQSREADSLVGEDVLIAPEFLLLECANVLTRNVGRGLIDRPSAEAAYAALESARVRLHPMGTLLPSAQRISLALGRSAYDSLYLALALRESAVLITADRRFFMAASTAYPGAIRLLDRTGLASPA